VLHGVLVAKVPERLVDDLFDGLTVEVEVATDPEHLREGGEPAVPETPLDLQGLGDRVLCAVEVSGLGCGGDRMSWAEARRRQP
jgi:hypothetical protein